MSKNRNGDFDDKIGLDNEVKATNVNKDNTNIPYPPGFTPANDIPACNNQDIHEAESVRPPSKSARSNSRVLEEAENSVDRVSSESFSNGVKIKEDGSILEILEEIITVGQTMGFSMEGCTKDMEKIIGTQGEQLLFPHFPAILSGLSPLRPQAFFNLRKSFLFLALLHFVFITLWLELPGFDDLVSKFWNSFTLDDSNGMIRFKKKLQMLKKEIRAWTLDFKRHQVGLSKDLNSKLCDIDKMLDQGGVTDDILLSRLEVLKQLHDVQSSNNRDIMQKAKIRWAIEGDENSKYFHAIINKKRANLSVKGIMVDGDWIVEPDLVKQEFRRHFTDRFQDPVRDEFFDHGDFAIGCNSSFVALIPKVLDPKVVSDYCPISLIGSLYKVVTKILASRLSLVISDLISDVQTAFLPNRQILDGWEFSSSSLDNRALLFQVGMRYSFLMDNTLWSPNYISFTWLEWSWFFLLAFNSPWSSIIEVNSLKVKGVDLISHCKIRVGKGTGTSFWKDLWIGDNLLKLSFPRLFALEENKHISVADKMNTSISSSFRRHVRGVKDVRSMLDDAFLPKMEVPTRWIKSILIKVNVFAWKLYLDRLPTRSNFSRRNVSLPSLACPLCDHVLEDSSHLFFGCSVAKDIQKLICR
ncbi:RNA-directed DNA polymerase, eukaryota [Tanacetum coccineum]